MNQQELKEFLDQKVIKYQRAELIELDPIKIPHGFVKKEDIEIAGFLVATIAWGNRKSILNNGEKMMEMLGNAPYDFVMNHTASNLKPLESFVHRTFNGRDFSYFIQALQNIYLQYGGLEKALLPGPNQVNYKNAIANFKTLFFSKKHLPRTEKHVSNPLKNSAAKRINMYLRWMVREDASGVDFGIWKMHKARNLSCPLDVHSGRVARKLLLLQRTQNDWKAVEELDTALRLLDKNDPVKYDFALFGLGVFEKF